MRYLDQLKKIFVLMVAAASIAIVNSSPAKALTTSEFYLQKIAEYTQSIMKFSQDILLFLQNPESFAGLNVSMMQQDSGDTSINTLTQNNLATLGATFTVSQPLINNFQKQFLADALGRPIGEFSGDPAPILLNVPDVNNIAYSSSLNLPPVAQKPVNLYDYVKNATGINAIHPMPSSSWEGNDDAKLKYKNYYNTVTAIETFSAYIISQLVLNNNNNVNETRNQLINTVSESSYIAKIGTEELGRVLRQILLFESQNFVLNTEIQKNLSQMVAAQAMTNALLIKLNDSNEYNMLRAAKGVASASAL